MLLFLDVHEEIWLNCWTKWHSSNKLINLTTKKQTTEDDPVDISDNPGNDDNSDGSNVQTGMRRALHNARSVVVATTGEDSNEDVYNNDKS